MVYKIPNALADNTIGTFVGFRRLDDLLLYCAPEPQTHINPEFLIQLAPATKQASSGPRDVANMPAPHGQCMFSIFSGVPKASVVLLRYKSLSMWSMLVHATIPSSSPGYEILGIGGMGHSCGFLPASSTHP